MEPELPLGGSVEEERSEPKDKVDSSASIGSAASVSSGLPFLVKMRIPLSAAVSTFHIGAKVYVPVVYISSFGGDASVIGAATVLLIFYSVWLQIVCGSMSDSGSFNRGAFSDLQRWGRRAPLAMCSLPVCMIGSLLIWGAPHSRTIGTIGVSLWYFFALWMVDTGVAMLHVAKLAAWSELFPSQTERRSLAPYVFAAQVFGILLGGTAVGTTSLSVESIEDASFRSMIYAFFAVGCCAVWLLAIPYNLLMTRSLLLKPVGNVATIWSMKDALVASSSLRWICLATHSSSSALLLFGSILPFFIVDVLGMTSDVVAEKTRQVMIGVIAFILIGLPVMIMAVRYLGSLRCCQMGGLMACFSHAFCHWTSMTMSSHHMLMMVCFCGLSYALMEICWGICWREYLPFVVDDDQIAAFYKAGGLQKEGAATLDCLPGRRDGLFVAVRLNASTFGYIWTGLFTMSLGLAGYDSEKFNRGVSQSAAVKAYVTFAFNIILPLLYMVFAIACFMFPLQGARLSALKAKHAQIFSRVPSETDDGDVALPPTMYGASEEIPTTAGDSLSEKEAVEQIDSTVQGRTPSIDAQCIDVEITPLPAPASSVPDLMKTMGNGINGARPAE